MRRLRDWLQINRLQRKVLLVVVVIIVVPMLIAGTFSAYWVTRRMDASIENWLRESTRLNLSWLNGLHHNARLFVDLLADADHERWHGAPGHPLVPPALQPLARELGISFIQMYDLDGRLVYASAPISTAWRPETGQDEAVVRIVRG